MNHHSNRGSAVIIALFIVTVLGVVGITVPPPGGKGASWLAPSTWRSHKPADDADKAKQNVAGSTNEVLHSIHVEDTKLGYTLDYVPDSPATQLAKRFSRNGLLLWGQVDTVAEAAELHKLVLDILSKDEKRVQAAEAAQILAERGNVALSTKLTQQRQDLVTKEAALRGAFEERNALANELETEHAHKVTLIIVATILLGLAVYFRANLASAGAVFHRLNLTNENSPVVKELTGELGKFGQWAIRSGRNAAADLEIKLRAKAARLAHRTGSTVV